MAIEHSLSPHARLELPRRETAAAESRWRKWLGEPLLHFVLLGVALFVAGELYRRHTDAYRIDITPQREAQLAKRYALQFGAEPNADTLRLLVDADIRDEILFREGLSLKLDQDDEIVRRRIVQKAQFLLQDTHAPVDPSSVQLEHYYDTHRARYTVPERVSFSHVYFAANNSDELTRARATAALEKLANNQQRAPQLGDPFPDSYDFAAYEPEQVSRLFGHSEFADAALSVPLAHWSGPFRSAYGWHLLYVAAREPARQLSLDEVRERVRTDYLFDAQAQANAAAFNDIARKFSVVRVQR